tara:strand:+ start:119 stop:880 length:762 start_codon:yes stop_codon:yes gene_type:complete
MKIKLTESQILFCIIFTLQKNFKLYRVEEKKSFIGNKVDKKLILNSVNYCKSYFENSENYNDNYSFDSVLKLINYSLFMSFSNTRNKYELCLLKDFRDYAVRLKPNSFNDLNFILDFWYSMDTDLFKQTGDYKRILLQAIGKSADADNWINNNPPDYFWDDPGRRPNYIFEHKYLCDVSSYMLNYIEQELDKPDWQQKPNDIVQRLKLTKSYPTWLLDTAQFIYNSTKLDSETIFPEVINKRELIDKYLTKET